MTELSTLRVYEAILQKEKELPADKKEDSVKMVEEMMKKQRQDALKEAQIKSDLLRIEKEKH